MAAIVVSVEIARSPEEVFSYASDPARFPEWQEKVVSARPESDAPLAVGSRAAVTRRVGRREQPAIEELVALDPPRSFEYRATGDRPVIAIATGTIEPLDGGRRSRVTVALDFEARGIGRLLVPLVIRPQARRQLPRDQQRLKELLEHDRAGHP
jgi:uncharacterized protein YndB with AHSA1/START domain